MHAALSWPLPEGVKHWHDSKVHGAVFAMETISLTTGKEMWLPPLQHKLEPLSSTLHGTCQHLSLFYVTLQEAPIALEHVHTVWESGGIWSIIFENCITNPFVIPYFNDSLHFDILEIV